MGEMVVQFLFLILMVVSLGYVLLKGGPSERAAALVVLCASILSPLAVNSGPQIWRGSEIGIFLVDLGALIAFGAIMLVSDRFWPIWTTAFQLLTVLAHVGPIFRAKSIAIPFAFAEQAWSWVILTQLIVVTAMLSRRRPPKPDAR